MKLAVIRRQFSSTGGAELYVQRLVAALADAGHHPHLFAESWHEPVAGAVMHTVAGGGSRAERPLRFAENVQAALATEEFDCVFSLDRTLKQDVYRAGDGVHRAGLANRRRFATWWKRPLTGFGAFHKNMLALEARTFDPGNTRHIIVNSNMVKREILEHFRFPEDRIHLVRNGIDVARFQSGNRVDTRRRFGIDDDEFTLLFVGSGWERKGLPHLIRTLAGLHSLRKLGQKMDAEFDDLPSVPRGRIRLLVVGKGRRPRGLPDNITFTGPMAAVEDAYAAADLFITLPFYEPSANVVSEALAAGLPVITTAQNGAAEQIREGIDGTVIPNPTQYSEIAHAICHWWSQRFHMPATEDRLLCLERNVRETIAVLETAARER